MTQRYSVVTSYRIITDTQSLAVTVGLCPQSQRYFPQRLYQHCLLTGVGNVRAFHCTLKLHSLSLHSRDDPNALCGSKVVPLCHNLMGVPTSNRIISSYL